MSTQTGYKVPIVPFLLALLLASHGLRKKSLSPSGALAAFVVGFVMMASRLNTFGVSLIVFYLIGSRATKVGKTVKSSLEDGHQVAGYRSAWQVLCNSFTAFAACLLWNGLYRDETSLSVVSIVSDMLSPELMSQGRLYSVDAWCPLGHSVGWSRYLLYVALGHFACCLGDTLASELGILSTSPPILITTLRRVPPGTNGGISALGTGASILGGAIMGITVAITLLLENRACRNEWVSLLLETTVWGAAAGLFGSFIDSILGATIQRTQYSASSKKILTDESPSPQASDAKDIKTISGIDVLSNNQVNLLSSVITAFALASMS